MSLFARQDEGYGWLLLGLAISMFLLRLRYRILEEGMGGEVFFLFFFFFW